MLKYTLYFLPIILFYQALIGDSGLTLIDQDLESLKKSAEKEIHMLKDFLLYAIYTEIKDSIFLTLMHNIMHRNLLTKDTG